MSESEDKKLNVEDDEEGNADNVSEKEEPGEEDEEPTKKEDKVHKGYGKRYIDETFGEEYDGEGIFSLIPPSDLDVLLGQPESKILIEKAEEKEPATEETATEGEEKSEGGEEAEEEEIKEIYEEGLLPADEGPAEKQEPGSDKPSLTSMTSSEYGMRITEYFMQPREKTPSEIQFEVDYREAIEEKMKKIIRPSEVDEEKERKIVQERKPIEKKRLQIADIDISGLYPQPKIVESELSFAFDEDEEGEKGTRGIQTDADVIMELLRESLIQDEENIFVKNVKEATQKVRQVVEEIVTMVRKGVPTDIAQKVHEGLPYFKVNLKINLIAQLKEHLQSARAIQLEEEEERKPMEVTESMVRRTKKRIPKIKSLKRLEEPVKEELEAITEEEKPEVPKEIKEKVEGIREEPLPKIEKEIKKKKEEEEEVQEIIPYEKINWMEFMTESEKQLTADPRLEAEMEKYIQERRFVVEREEKLLEEKRQKRLRYKKPKDSLEIIKNENLIVTMKFLLNSGDMYTSAYKFFMPFREIKEDLSQVFKVPCEVFIIYRGEEEVEDHKSAFDLEPEIEPFDTVTFRLLTLDNDRWRLKSDFLDLPVPDIITCTVETGKDYQGVSEFKEVVVEIENRQIKKPFVGGYKDCATGIEYHHAFSQSGPKPSKVSWQNMLSRETQTVVTKEKIVDTNMEKSTQMARRDYYVSTESDKIMRAKPYVDYENWCKNRDFEGKVRIIQRYIRAMIIRKFLKKMSEEYKKRQCWEMEQEKKRILERENRIKSNIINMTYPKTKADFDMLYSLVEKWRKAQIQRISQLKTEAPKKAELCAVLEKEIKLLEAIEVHRIAVNKQRKRLRALNFMEKVATPITWTGYRGMTIRMDSLKTQRARELKELYQSLSRNDLDYQDRIELLISVKHALRIHCTKLTEELSGLIDQECEMLIRGVKAKDLDYLRQRIEHLFQEYFKDPIFNPEAAKYDHLYNKEPLRHYLLCKSCQQTKPLKNFSAAARDKSIKVCTSCHWLQNIAISRVDLNPYSYILKMVRKDEQKRNCYSSCAFILQDEDMRFLVENIWKNKSAVSEHDNLLDLRMPRWDRSKDWTPWNCILLTELEAKAHLKTNPEDNYEPQIIGEVITKHELAKRHFQQLYSTAKRIRDSGKWANVVDVKKYSPPPITADLWDIKPDECERLKKSHALYEVHEWPLGNDTMKSKMEIDPTTQKDAGYYECQADNQYAIDRRGFRTDYVIYTY